MRSDIDCSTSSATLASSVALRWHRSGMDVGWPMRDRLESSVLRLTVDHRLRRDV